MRDPLSWALTVFRAFGIPVKVHLFFFVVTLGFFLRVVTDKYNPVAAWEVFLLTVVLLFGLVLVHEFGHCFGARHVGGDAKEILIWPLGGLAFVEVPHNPRANFIVAAAGPAVNVLVCVLVTVALAASSFVPNFNPLANPFVSQIHNFADGRDYTSKYALKLYKAGTAEPAAMSPEAFERGIKAMGGYRDRFDRPVDFNKEVAEEMKGQGVEWALAPDWAVWLNRIFWLSWVTLLFNLLPAYPLDGGQMLQAVVWGRTDYRRGVVVAAYSGFVVSILFLVVSIWKNEALFMGLALFMLYQSSMRLHTLDAEGGEYGDFSAGYTSLERDDEPPPKVKKPGPVARWLAARKARRAARDLEQRQRDDARMDELLEKIARSGKASLTDDERRFLERVSARFRNRS